MKKPFIEIDIDNVQMSAFEIKPIDGYEAPKKFPDCCNFHITVLENANEWFKEFPYCCSPHTALKTKSWFKKDDYKDVPQKIIQQLSYTEHHILKQIDISEWYKDITDYIEYNVLSFGLPAIGLHLYLGSLDQYIKAKDVKIAKEKKQKLVQYIATYFEPKQTSERDLNILYSTYQKWLKTFPFDISYFNNIKQQFAKQLPIIKGEIEHNPYSGLSKAKLYTSIEFIEALEHLTKQLLNSINIAELVEKGTITNLNKEQIQLENESLRIDIAELAEDYAKGELKYVKLLKKWLNRHKEYFGKLGALIKAGPIVVVTQSVAKEEKPTSMPINNFDHVKIEEVYNHFYKGLVEKKYLTEDELLAYLKAAFEQMTVPSIRFRLRNTPTKFKVMRVFNEYYKLLVGKPHGRQREYAALLGDYFEGYTTDSVRLNFSR